ncbi:MAG: hypothetical protein ACYS8K_10330, partial [Planctomycetota bacterium]
MDAGSQKPCPNCGTALGAHVRVCPQCGADVVAGRTGGTRAKRKKKSQRLPLLIGAGIVVGLGVLAVLILFAVRLLAERREMAAKKAAKPARERKVVATTQKAKAAPSEAEQKALAALEAREKEIKQAVAEYRKRLKDALGKLRTASPGEMAGLWADLYVFCRDNGLPTEAEQCWSRAVLLRPAEQAVNAKLGRTELFAGVPVTPEQKGFLEGLRPSLVIVNNDPALSNHTVRVNRGTEAPLAWSSPAQFQVDAGPAFVEVVPAGGEGAKQEFTLSLVSGLVYTVSFEQALSAPSPSFNRLEEIYSAVAERAFRASVRVNRDDEGKVQSAQAGGLRAEGTAGEALMMQLSRSGDLLTLAGALVFGSRYDPNGEHVFYGEAGERLRFDVDPARKTMTVRTGRYYNLKADFADGLWGALGAAEGDFASERARRRLARVVDEVEFENAALEASGKPLGPWQLVTSTYHRVESRRGEAQQE